MGLASRAGDWTFKVFTAGVGVATTYLAATFAVNVYRGLSLHNTQSAGGHIWWWNVLSVFRIASLSLKIMSGFIMLETEGGKYATLTMRNFINGRQHTVLLIVFDFSFFIYWFLLKWRFLKKWTIPVLDLDFKTSYVILIFMMLLLRYAQFFQSQALTF